MNFEAKLESALQFSLETLPLRHISKSPKTQEPITITRATWGGVYMMADNGVQAAVPSAGLMPSV